MPSMTNVEYQQIKAGVMRRHAEKALLAEVEKIMPKPGPMTFTTVDEFMAYLELLTA
jgi:hypothetical protein